MSKGEMDLHFDDLLFEFICPIDPQALRISGEAGFTTSAQLDRDLRNS